MDKLLANGGIENIAGYEWNGNAVLL